MFDTAFKKGLNCVLVHLCSLPVIPLLQWGFTCLFGISSYQSSPSFDLLSHILLRSLSMLAIHSTGQPSFPGRFGSLQKLKDWAWGCAGRKQASTKGFYLTKISKSHSVGAQVSPGNALWRNLRGYCLKRTATAIVCGNFLGRDPLKHRWNTGRKIPLSVEHLCILKNTALVSTKHLFLWDRSCISHKTSFSQLNIFVGIRTIKSIKLKMWQPWKCTGIAFSKTFEVTLA